MMAQEQRRSACAALLLGLPALLLVALPALSSYRARRTQQQPRLLTGNAGGGPLRGGDSEGARRLPQPYDRPTSRDEDGKPLRKPGATSTSQTSTTTTASEAPNATAAPAIATTTAWGAPEAAAEAAADNGSSAEQPAEPKREAPRATTSSPPQAADAAYEEQPGAAIPAGGSVRLYAFGSSSLLWMTWLDQLHLMLRDLGYSLPLTQATYKPRFFPKTVPQCDDSRHFEYLKTARFARIGWSSWDFAFEGWRGCSADGFRDIVGYPVKCQHGPGCHYSTNPLNSSRLADDAAQSNITLLATWFNDFEQRWSHYSCLANKTLSHEQIRQISASNLVKNIRQIHQRNPDVWVVVLAKYSQTVGHKTEDWLRRVNAEVKKAVELEPRTIFADFEMPGDDVAALYQQAHSGHPNCRGSRYIAQSVVNRLFEEKVLGRGLKSFPSENSFSVDCASLDAGGCHASPMCWVDPESGTCSDYGEGSSSFHTVCEGAVCEGEEGLTQEEE